MTADDGAGAEQEEGSTRSRRFASLAVPAVVPSVAGAVSNFRSTAATGASHLAHSLAPNSSLRLELPKVSRLSWCHSASSMTIVASCLSVSLFLTDLALRAVWRLTDSAVWPVG